LTWSVLPLAAQLHDPRAYAEAARLAAGLDSPLALPPPGSAAQPGSHHAGKAPPTGGGGGGEEEDFGSEYGGGGGGGGGGQAGRFSSAHSIGSASRSFHGIERGGSAHSGSVYGGSVYSESSFGPNIGEFLELAKLGQHESRLRQEGYEEVDDLVDAADADLVACGLKKPEVRRLRRYLQGGQ